MSTQPTDEEIDAVTLEVLGYAALDKNTNETARLIARAVLAKWGTPPAVAGEDPLRAAAIELRDAPDLRAMQRATAKLYAAIDTTPQPTQAQAGAVPLTESEMGEGWRKFQETLDDRMAADPAGVRSMGREHWLSWAHWKAACSFARGIKGGQRGDG